MGNGLTIKSKGDAGTGERVTLTLQDQNSSDYHYVGMRFSTANNHTNYLRWYLKDTNGTLQQCCMMRADKSMNIYMNLYLVGHAYAVSFNASSDQSIKDDVKDLITVM